MTEIRNLDRKALKEVAKKLVEKIGDRRGSDLNETAIDQICTEIIHDQPRNRLKLVYRHSCKYLGCRAVECLLCRTNPNKICLQDFDDRYYVNDTISISKCKAPVCIDIVDSSSGDLYMDPIAGLAIKMCLLDGQRYLEASNQCSRVLRQDEIDSITIMDSRNGGQLLKMPGTSKECVVAPSPSSGNGHSIQLPRLMCTESSEALLHGKCLPFVLYSYAVSDTWEGAFDIMPAVSTPFVVASRRLKKNCKVEIPLESDGVMKLKHIGRETVSKLHKLGEVLKDSDTLSILPRCLHSIDNVGQFCELASIARSNIALEATLKQKLKFKDEMWKEAAEHAMRSVPIDSRVRVWCPFSVWTSPSTVGYVFECRVGEPNLSCPIGVIKYFPGDHEHVACKLESVPNVYQTMLELLKSRWQEAWKQDGHPGWGIEKLETSDFISSKQPFFRFKSSIVTHTVLPNNTEMEPYVPPSAFAQAAGSDRVPSMDGEIPDLLHDFPSLLNESLRLLSGELESMSMARQVSLDRLLNRNKRKTPGA